MAAAPSRDLVVLTADRNAEFALRGVLSRFHSLAIRPVNPEYYVHPEKDSGVFHHAHDYLRPFTRAFAHALVLMDREGSGREHLSRKDMEQHIEDNLRTSGWGNRAAALVIDPELENWIWSDSPHVDKELGWIQQAVALRAWLRKEGFLTEGTPKPPRPKEALEATLRQAHRPRSSAIYRAIAEKVGLSRCTDPAFLKLRDLLTQWFPQR